MHFGHPRLGSTTGFHGQRCCGLVPWSWIIVCVRKAKSGGYPKVTAGNRLAKHGSPSAAPLVGRPRAFGSRSIAAVSCRLGVQGEKAEPPTEENALTLAKRRAITGIIPLITTL